MLFYLYAKNHKHDSSVIETLVLFVFKFNYH